MPNTVRLAFLGDLMLGRGVSRKLHDHPPDWFWGDALPILRQADGVIANLESPITNSDDRWRRTWKFFHFKASPDAVEILSAANVRFVCLANNHTLDYGRRGLLDTIEVLDRAGISHAGAGRNDAAASASQILKFGDLSVGVIAATDNMPEFAAKPGSAGTNYREFRPDSSTLEWVEASVEDLRQRGVGLVVLSVHWGPNMRITPSRNFRRFAHAAIERGVDVIHGHSAHVVQAIERYRDGVILYDTGNFLDDYWKFPFRHTVWSFIFTLIVEDSRATRLVLVPIVTHSSPLGLATGEVIGSITQSMKSLCARFGTTIVDVPVGLEVPLR